jgi:hypothetical protein
MTKAEIWVKNIRPETNNVNNDGNECFGAHCQAHTRDRTVCEAFVLKKNRLLAFLS